MRKYASILDKQPEVRTKVSEAVYDQIEGFAKLHGWSDYEAVRVLIGLGLAVIRGQRRITLDNGG